MRIKRTGYTDINGRDIFTNMVCEDTSNFVTVVIKESNDKFYAVPDGLDAEPLEDVASYLKIVR